MEGGGKASSGESDPFGDASHLRAGKMVEPIVKRNTIGNIHAAPLKCLPQELVRFLLLLVSRRHSRRNKNEHVKK